MSQIDAITNVNQPNFYGVSEPFSHISLTATPTGGGPVALIGQTEAGSDGSWTITSNRLADGSYTIAATAVDQSGKTNVTLPASPVVLLPNAIQGPLVIDTVGPKITTLFFDRLNGQVDVTFQDDRSGMVDSAMLDAANYRFNKVYTRPVGTYLVNVLAVTPGGPTDARQVVATINKGHSIRGGHYLFTVYAENAIKKSGIQDIAGNALDGEFYGFFPSGNNVRGGDFEARIYAVHHVIYSPLTTVGEATPVVPPGQKLPPVHISKPAPLTKTLRNSRLTTRQSLQLAQQHPRPLSETHDAALHVVAGSSSPRLGSSAKRGKV